MSALLVWAACWFAAMLIYRDAWLRWTTLDWELEDALMFGLLSLLGPMSLVISPLAWACFWWNTRPKRLPRQPIVLTRNRRRR